MQRPDLPSLVVVAPRMLRVLRCCGCSSVIACACNKCTAGPVARGCVREHADWLHDLFLRFAGSRCHRRHYRNCTQQRTVVRRSLLPIVSERSCFATPRVFVLLFVGGVLSQKFAHRSSHTKRAREKDPPQLEHCRMNQISEAQRGQQTLWSTAAVMRVLVQADSRPRRSDLVRSLRKGTAKEHGCTVQMQLRFLFHCIMYTKLRAPGNTTCSSAHTLFCGATSGDVCGLCTLGKFTRMEGVGRAESLVGAGDTGGMWHMWRIVCFDEARKTAATAFSAPSNR